MGFGAEILVNLPFSGAIGAEGMLDWLFDLGISQAEAFPLLLFIAPAR